MTLLMYLILNLIIAATEDYKRTLNEINTIRVFYGIVTVFSFLRLILHLQIYEGFSFVTYSAVSILTDVRHFIYFAVIMNSFFACLFMIFDTDIGSEYDKVWGPLKWFVYALRNGLHDYQFSENGFVPKIAV